MEAIQWLEYVLKVKNSRKSSPEAGSSDSDDSLPPYPVMEKNNSDSEIPLPPPPLSIESCVSVPEKTSTSNVSAIKSSSSSKLQLFSQGRVDHGILSVWFRYEKFDQLKQELLCSSKCWMSLFLNHLKINYNF